MADTTRTLAELLDPTTGLFRDSNNIPAQSARDLIKTVYGGGLEPNAQTLTGSDLTGAVGQLYVLTISGLTANRNVTLPSAGPGQRVGVYVADGDDTYAIILKGAASQTINGGSAATEWSRVFLKGECVIFLCIAANTWIVEIDKRLPTSCKLSKPTSQTGIVTSTDTLITLDNSVIDVGALGNTSTNRITIRRASTYLAEAFFSIGSMPVSTRLNFKIYSNGAFLVGSGTFSIVMTGTGTAHGVMLLPGVAAGDYLQLYGWHQKGSNGDTGTSVNSPILSIMEVLS